MIKRILRGLVITLIVSVFLPACILTQPNTSQPDEDDIKDIPSIEASSTKTAIRTPIPKSTDPYLLIQTGFDTYKILDVKNNQNQPFVLPVGNQQYDLKKNLSPSGSLMLFPINDQEVVVLSLITGKVVKTFGLQGVSKMFSSELAAEAAENAFPDLNFTEEDLETAVTNTFTASILNYKWFKNDRYLLITKIGNETNTHLYLYDLQSGTSDILESAGGLVEDYWVSPDGEMILLKKGLITDPFHWEDDRYYLLDLGDRSITAIHLPAEADMPSIFWFSTVSIGIIHQPEYVGGNNFSLLDITTMESRLVVPDNFIGLYSIKQKLLTLHQDKQKSTTLLKLRELTGEIVQSKDVKGTCYVNAIVKEQGCLLSCETKSYLIEFEPFSIAPFVEPIQIFSLSPDGNKIIVINRQYQASSCEPGLEECYKLALDAETLEILWLPDSSGFLYRASSKLFHYDFVSNTKNILLSSDLFSDYRNLNAVWVNFGERQSAD